ncbi:MAG TPA: glycosyltransferase [Novosphingobium sp.]|nr:glycosyltransferase [Novosphingobium sp.]
MAPGENTDLPEARPLERRRLQCYLALILGDIAALFAGYCASGYLYLGRAGLSQGLELAQLVLPLFLTVGLYNGAYSIGALRTAQHGVRRALSALALSAATVLFISFYSKSSQDTSRVIYTLGLIAALIGVVWVRAQMRSLVRWRCGETVVNELLIEDGGPTVEQDGVMRISAAEYGLRPALDDPAALNRIGQLCALRLPLSAGDAAAGFDRAARRPFRAGVPSALAAARGGASDCDRDRLACGSPPSDAGFAAMNAQIPRISVLLPVRNGEPYFAAALESILAQEGASFEVIVVDDGSTDGTPDLLAACSDPRLRVLRREGGGLVAALNAALAEARGEYCARMDADDIALPGRFAAQVMALDADPGAVMVHSAAELIDGTDRPIGMIAAEPLSQAERRAVLLGERAGPPIVHPTAMLRRGALTAAGGYRESPSCEDHELWLRLIEHARFIALPQPLLLYRQHEQGISRQRTVEQAISNLTNCAAARWREMTGIDLMRDAPQVWAELRANTHREARGYALAMASARTLRTAVRGKRPVAAAKAALALVATGRIWLLFNRLSRWNHRRIQSRLLGWLSQHLLAKAVAPGNDAAH